MFVSAYLRRVAGEAAHHILNGFSQVAALLLHSDQEVIQLLTPAQHTPFREAVSVSHPDSDIIFST